MLYSSLGQDVTTTSSVSTDEAFIAFVTVHSTATAGTLVIKDGLNASGTVIFRINIGANESSKYCPFPVPLRAKNGVYVELTNTTANIGTSG